MTDAKEDFLKICFLVGTDIAKELVAIKYAHNEYTRVEVAKWLLPTGYIVE